MRFIAVRSVLFCLAIAFASIGLADSPGSKADIEKALTSQYALTKATDDKTDIVTAGAVLVLQKDKLVMVTADSAANQCPNTFKDGKLSQAGSCKVGGILKAKRLCPFCPAVPGEDKVPNTRAFVTGEKFWVTKIEVRDSGKDSAVVMDFFSDPINEVRYKGTLTIPFKKGLPSADDALKLVGEVVTVAPSEEAKGDDKQQGSAQGQQQAPQQAQGQAPAAAQTPAQAEPANAAPPAEIAPPPPPPDAPTAPPAEVSIGQTPEQVVAALGEPTKKAKVGIKEIYYYKDMKVIFQNGKVKDVQ